MSEARQMLWSRVYAASFEALASDPLMQEKFIGGDNLLRECGRRAHSHADAAVAAFSGTESVLDPEGEPGARCD